MAPRGAHRALAALLALFGALLTDSGDAQVFIHPQDPILPQGGSMVVNCSTSCDKPTQLGLETQLTKEEVDYGDKWKIFRLKDVSEDNSLLCHSSCGGVQATASTVLTVYGLPERVELEPLPPWQPVGENLTLRCRVEGGAPRANLTVVLLRGEEELHQQSTEGEPARKPAEVTVTVPARREDHGANFTCRTELDLRSRGLGLFENSSASRQLRTFALPVTDPLLSSPQIFEVGKESKVTCTLDGVFPVSEAQVYMALGDHQLNPVTVRNMSALEATAQVTADTEDKGFHTLVCVVMLGNQSRATREQVTVYSFPKPNLTLSEQRVTEETVVTVVCEAHPQAVVTLVGSPALTPTPTQPTESRVQFQFTARAEDNGRSFLCSAALSVQGQIVHKNQTEELQVLYGPRLDEEDCPGNWTWEEGSEQILKCQAWGNPPPSLSCLRKDNIPLPIGHLKPVKREHQGFYLCRAESERGEVTRQVVVNVLYHHNHLALILTLTTVAILSVGGVAAYLYNRQRKIRKYKLQKAQEAAAMKMNTPP
ncbi:PREDICTED: intercellular adhesion molecule 1 [Elephantulus edwardii]|uniref:intercellular adhesion molecule 1 n=1 Tax=Elephantulus edwardii TaxID=28737 RepID=UPI0003F0D61C|nr:PREDICTED: intercellular adhesion molecule 1 [Elephantulus edwardii]